MSSPFYLRKAQIGFSQPRGSLIRHLAFANLFKMLVDIGTRRVSVKQACIVVAEASNM